MTTNPQPADVRRRIAKMLHLHRTGVPADPSDGDFSLADKILTTLDLRTVERCAEVADSYVAVTLGADAARRQIAAAIRSLPLTMGEG